MKLYLEMEEGWHWKLSDHAPYKACPNVELSSGDLANYKQCIEHYEYWQKRIQEMEDELDRPRREAQAKEDAEVMQLRRANLAALEAESDANGWNARLEGDER